jgi:hypothetical protein
MQRSEWDFDNTADHDEADAPEPKSPEALVDQFGIRTALLVLCRRAKYCGGWMRDPSLIGVCCASRLAPTHHGVVGQQDDDRAHDCDNHAVNVQASNA